MNDLKFISHEEEFEVLSRSRRTVEQKATFRIGCFEGGNRGIDLFGKYLQITLSYSIFPIAIPWQTRGRAGRNIVGGGSGVNVFAESSSSTETINQLGIYGIMTLEAKYRYQTN